MRTDMSGHEWVARTEEHQAGYLVVVTASGHIFHVSRFGCTGSLALVGTDVSSLAPGASIS